MSDAQTWVGTRQDTDKLVLNAIVNSLPQEATHLRNILADARVTGLLAMRREASDTAAGAQRRFKQLSAAAVAGAAFATLASGLLLYGEGSNAAASAATPPVEGLLRWVKEYRIVIVLVQVAGLFVSAVASGMLGFQDLVARWAENRRRAELNRREVFNEVLRLAQEIQPPIPAPDSSNAVRQALEFFRRYQLELQIGFYGTAKTRHENSASALAWATAVLAGVAAITGALGGLGGTALIVSAFLGIAVPILLSAAQSWRAVSRDTDKATAYEKARAELQKIQLDLTEVRKKADLADADTVRAYIDKIHLVMANENEAWVPAPRS